VGQAIGQILPYAVAVAVSPVPIIGVVLMLSTPRARTNGPAFLLGWTARLAILGTHSQPEERVDDDWRRRSDRPDRDQRRRAGRNAAVYILIATLGVAAPVVLYFALGNRSAAILEELKDWMAHNNAAIMAVLLLVIGAKLIGDGISGLSS
jgi:Sap, sulfolipid-1-addressing protein